MPKSNVSFWENKIMRNKERDEEVRDKLRAIGWRTMVVWECQLKPAVRQQTLEGIVFLLNEAFLDLHRRKPSAKPYYETEPEEEQRMVAEDTPRYGKGE